MEQLGFIRDMLDVKILILFVTANAAYPLTLQKIYELCFQDDCLSYFDVSLAIPEMVETGHLREVEKGLYEITQMGREHEEMTKDAIAYPVMKRAEAAVARFNRDMRRNDRVRTQIIPRKEGDFSVLLSLDDDQGNLMTLELMAPTQSGAVALEKQFCKNAGKVYHTVMKLLLEGMKADSGGENQ